MMAEQMNKDTCKSIGYNYEAKEERTHHIYDATQLLS